MRGTLATLLALMMLPGASVMALAQGDLHMLDLPVLVAECNRDPGTMLTPGGGRFDPAQVMDDYECEPAEGVSVTVYHREEGEAAMKTAFFARCETDDEGICRVEAPTDPERELMVAVHMSTVTPGFAPAHPLTPTVHFSEFTGVGIALLPDPALDEGQLADLPDRRTLALKVEQDGEPAEVLTQLSEADVAIDDFPWLAPNGDGWVSYDLGLFDSDTVDLMLDIDGEPEFACSDIDNHKPLAAEWIEGFEGDFIRITLPETDGNINCEITLP
jgi:hypothetical protein